MRVHTSSQQGPVQLSLDPGWIFSRLRRVVQEIDGEPLPSGCFREAYAPKPEWATVQAEVSGALLVVDEGAAQVLSGAQIQRVPERGAGDQEASTIQKSAQQRRVGRGAGAEEGLARAVIEAVSGFANLTPSNHALDPAGRVGAEAAELAGAVDPTGLEGGAHRDLAEKTYIIQSGATIRRDTCLDGWSQIRAGAQNPRMGLRIQAGCKTIAQNGARKEFVLRQIALTITP